MRTRLEEILDVLRKHQVAVVVIGGQAANLHGSPKPTFDVDLCYSRTKDNIARLAGALRDLNPSLRGAPAGLPYVLDARSITAGLNFTLVTDLGDLDLLGEVEPLGGYDKVKQHAEAYTLGEYQVDVISLDDLIAIKQHINRPKDRDSLYQLLAIKKIRNEQQGR